MIRPDDAFSDAVAARVAALERATDAEIVVVVAQRSGSYADLSARGASVVALTAAAGLIAIPWHIGELWFVIDTALAWLLAERVLRARPFVRALSGARRRRAQVAAAALQEFVVEAVHGTPNHSGVLVYVSLLEELVEVVPDLGIEGRVPGGELAPVRALLRADTADHLLAGLTALGGVLARHVPHTEQSDAFDLADAPRIRP